MIEQPLDVVDLARLRVRAGIVGHGGRRKAPRVERDRPVASRKEAHLQMPALVVPVEFVREHQGLARADFVIEQIDAVDRGDGHAFVLSM